MTDQPLVAAPLYRAVDAFTGEVRDLAAECARLSDENAELRCRVDELTAERDEWRMAANAEAEGHNEARAERDILASQRTELVGQRNTALYERDTARAELAARS